VLCLPRSLARSKTGKLSDVQRYLNAGGSPNATVGVFLGFDATLPLLCSVAVSMHPQSAESLKVLLDAGAAPDASFLDAGQNEHSHCQVDWPACRHC
jgi:hypothetical protein